MTTAHSVLEAIQETGSIREMDSPEEVREIVSQLNRSLAAAKRAIDDVDGFLVFLDDDEEIKLAMRGNPIGRYLEFIAKTQEKCCV